MGRPTVWGPSGWFGHDHGSPDPQERGGALARDRRRAERP